MKKFIPIIAIILVLMISLALYFGLTSKRYEEIHFSSESELLELDNSENKFNVYKNHEIIHLGSDTYLYFGIYPKTVVLDESLISNLNKLNTINARGNYYYNGYEYKKITAGSFVYESSQETLTDEEYFSKTIDTLEEFTYNYIESYIKDRPSDPKSKALSTYNLDLSTLTEEELNTIKENSGFTLHVKVSADNTEINDFDFDIDLTEFDFDAISKTKEIKIPIKYVSNPNVSIENGKSYYFKIEPILFKVLKVDNKKYTIISNDVIDTYYFDYDTNEYLDSDIREYLNDGLLNNAFDTEEINSIIKTSIGTELDNIAIPSIEDYNSYNLTKATPTDYSLASGAYYDSSYTTYLLRDIVEGTEKNIYKIGYDGHMDVNGTRTTYYGISAYSGVRVILEIVFK